MELYLCYVIYNYPPTPSRGGLEGSSPEVNTTPLDISHPLNNPPSTVPNAPNEPDSNPDPKFSDYSPSD